MVRSRGMSLSSVSWAFHFGGQSDHSCNRRGTTRRSPGGHALPTLAAGCALGCPGGQNKQLESIPQTFAGARSQLVTIYRRD